MARPSASELLARVRTEQARATNDSPTEVSTIRTGAGEDTGAGLIVDSKRNPSSPSHPSPHDTPVASSIPNQPQPHPNPDVSVIMLDDRSEDLMDTLAPSTRTPDIDTATVATSPSDPTNSSTSSAMDASAESPAERSTGTNSSPGSGSVSVVGSRGRVGATSVMRRRGSGTDVAVLANFVDPRRWVPIAPGSAGFAKKAPVVPADLVAVIERRKLEVTRLTRKKVSWDQVFSMAVAKLPRPKEAAALLTDRREMLGLDDPTIPRRRITGMVTYETADMLDDLALEVSRLTNRRVSLEDLWALALSLLVEDLEQAV